MKDLVIVGTGAMARDVTAFVNRYQLYNIVGYSCNKEYVESSRHAHPEWDICALDELEEKYNKNNVELFVAISQFQMLNRVRKDTFNNLKKRGFHFATLISPTATVLSKRIGEGCWIQDSAYLSTETEIGNNVIVDILCYIAHFSKIHDHVFVAGRATLFGSVTVGEQGFIGAASTIFNDVTIGTKCLIGGGTTIKKDVPPYTQCKLPNDGVIMKQYDEDTIEMKLLPPGMVEKS